MTAPIIETVVPEVFTPVPQRTQGQAEFDANADAFLASLPGVATGINAAAAEFNEAAAFVNLKAAETDADAIATAADRVQTGLDRVQTGLDRTATAADRVQTGLDRTQTGLDALATASDVAQTEINKQESAESRDVAVVNRVQAQEAAAFALMDAAKAAMQAQNAEGFSNLAASNAQEAKKFFLSTGVGIVLGGYYTMLMNGVEVLIPYFFQQPAIPSFSLDFLSESYTADFNAQLGPEPAQTVSANFLADTYQLDDGVPA